MPIANSNITMERFNQIRQNSLKFKGGFSCWNKQKKTGNVTPEQIQQIDKEIIECKAKVPTVSKVGIYIRNQLVLQAKAQQQRQLQQQQQKQQKQQQQNNNLQNNNLKSAQNQNQNQNQNQIQGVQSAGQTPQQQSFCHSCRLHTTTIYGQPATTTAAATTTT